jgi:hypothetical protein
MSTVMSTDQDTRPVVDVVPLPQPAAQEVLALFSRQADLLAAAVEAALADEDARHAQQLQDLTEQHQQRRAALLELAGALGQQCTDLDEAAATLATTGTPVTMFGFASGDRVRDPRSGCTGRVRLHALCATERAAGLSPADIVWDGFETVVDLDLAVAHGLQHAPEPPR